MSKNANDYWPNKQTKSSWMNDETHDAMVAKMKDDDILNQVQNELVRATAKFGPFHSMHEGWAVIKEEEEELKDEVFWGTKEQARVEAIQLAAMALRFLRDCY